MNEPALEDRRQTARRTTSGPSGGRSRRAGGSSASERGALPLRLDRIALAPVHPAARSTVGIPAGEAGAQLSAAPVVDIGQAVDRSQEPCRRSGQTFRV